MYIYCMYFWNVQPKRKKDPMRKIKIKDENNRLNRSGYISLWFAVGPQIDTSVILILRLILKLRNKNNSNYCYHPMITIIKFKDRNNRLNKSDLFKVNNKDTNHCWILRQFHIAQLTKFSLQESFSDYVKQVLVWTNL